MAGQAVQLQAMRTAIREIADEEEIQQDRISAAELDRRINRGLRRLYGKLVRAGGHERYAKEHAIATVSGQQLYPMPLDFGVALLGITATDGSSWRDLSPWEQSDLEWIYNRYERSTSSTLQSLHYRIQNDELDMRPTPRAVYTLTLRYVPTFQDLVNDTDSFDGVCGFEEWAYLTVAIGLKDKDEEPPAALERERALVQAEIDDLAANRDAGKPPVVQDTRKDRRYLYGYFLGPYSDNWGA